MNWNDGSEDYNVIFDLRKKVKELEATVATLQQEAVANQNRWDELLDEREKALSNAFDSEVRTQGEAVKWRTAAERAEATVATLTAERDDLLAERVEEIMAGQASGATDLLELFGELELALYGKRGNTWEVGRSERVMAVLRKAAAVRAGGDK
jgi:hypothetical protein